MVHIVNCCVNEFKISGPGILPARMLQQLPSMMSERPAVAQEIQEEGKLPEANHLSF